MLTLNNLCVAYPQKTVVQEVSFELQTGQIGCLLGPSGCGKTTLLRAIAGFEKASGGEVLLRGRVVSQEKQHTPPEKRNVAVVFQDYALFPHLTVAQNIGFGLTKTNHSERQKRVVELLVLVGLEGYESQYPHALSGGQQQRVALARAMAPRPDLLLLDEPFSSLDAELRDELAKELRRILKHENTTALMVTHDQDEAFAMADVIGVINQGQLLQWDNAYGLYHRPASRFVASFIGDGVFLPAVVDNHNRLASSLGVFPIPSSKFELGVKVSFLVRPDDIVHDDDSQTVAKVMARTFKGSHILYELELQNTYNDRVLCLALSHHDHQLGELIGIKLDMAHLIIFAEEAS